MKNVTAVIPAAGLGKRLGASVSKPYVCLNNKPLLAYTLTALEKSEKVKTIILVVEKNQISRAKSLVSRYNIRKVALVIRGGLTRSESVRNGIFSLGKDTDFVLIHDGARPFVSVALIDKCIRAAELYKAAICAVPCVATIKSVDNNLNVISTFDRNKLWEAQTPQVFSYKIIKKAYESLDKGNKIFFDDASLVEQLPHKVKIVPGEYFNIKITTRADLEIARAILRRK